MLYEDTSRCKTKVFINPNKTGPLKRFATIFSLAMMLCIPVVIGVEGCAPVQTSPMREWFDTWHRNRMRYNAYNDSLFISCERQEWIARCNRRSSELRVMFAENQACIDALHAHFSQPADSIPAADYDTLFALCKSHGEGLDRYMMNDMKRILMQHYEEVEMPEIYAAKVDDVRSGIGSYAHSEHLRVLSVALLKGVIRHKPELLLGMPGCKTVKDVRAHSDSLESFIGQAAILHDLGKNTMGEIVSNEFRKLYDEEFEILKTHPEAGLEYLKEDPALEIFHDMTLGHHRWYDGSKGYPMWFDNTKSPIRVMIDILTLCDCLEAATDAVGRSYAPRKVFQQLMAEFDEGAGTRYNPEVLQVMHNNKDLYQELEIYVSPEACYNSYYEVFKMVK